MTMIANMAYGQVKLGTDKNAGGGDTEYEVPDKLVRSELEPEHYEQCGQWQYESIPAIRLRPVSI